MDRSVQSWGELVDAADRGLNGSGAVVEASRRLTAGLAAFEASSRSSSQTLLEAQTRLLIAINASSDCAATQNGQMIKLTNALKALTWALVAVGAVQIIVTWWK